MDYNETKLTLLKGMQAASLVLVPRALFGALAFPRVRP